MLQPLPACLHVLAPSSNTCARDMMCPKGLDKLMVLSQRMHFTIAVSSISVLGIQYFPGAPCVSLAAWQMAKLISRVSLGTVDFSLRFE